MVDLRGGVVFQGIVVWFGGSLHNRVKAEAGSYLDEGDMEDLGRHAEKSQSKLG